MEFRDYRINTCPHCGESFADGAAYCGHRVGPPLARRCLDHREMLLFGFRYSTESTWYYLSEDPAWLLRLNRTEHGFACRWPPQDGPAACQNGSGRARRASDVLDSDAIAERLEEALRGL